MVCGCRGWWRGSVRDRGPGTGGGETARLRWLDVVMSILRVWWLLEDVVQSGPLRAAGSLISVFVIPEGSCSSPPCMQKGVGRGENAHISWHGFGGDTLIPKPQRNAPRVQIFQYMWKLGRLEALSSVWGDSSARRVYPGLPRLRYRFQNKQVLKKEDIHVYFPSRTFWRNRRGQKYTLDSRGWATLDIHSFKHDSSPGGWRGYSSWADVENEPAERLSRWLRSQSRDTRLYILMLYILCLPKGRYYMFSEKIQTREP